MSHLLIFTGPSGTGKSTILDRLMQRENFNAVRFVTTTTRAPRPGEIDGKDYWFMTREEFEREVQADHFYEWANVYGNLYGSMKREMERLETLGKPIMFVTDVQGAKTIHAAHPEAFIIFIDAPKANLIHRLEIRGTDAKEMETRVKKIEEEEKFRSQASLVVVNEDGKLDETIETVALAIQKHLETT